MMANRFDGKVAFVTGGGSGIGEACAMAYAKEGAQVAVADIQTDAANRVVEAIKATGGSAIPITVDVTNFEAVGKAIEKIIETFGGLDIAVNNAGIGGEQAPVGSYTPEGWLQIINVNLNSVFYCLRHEIPAMQKRGGGAIVNMASILGQVGFANSAGYVAAKHAVVGLTKNAAIEYATENIRVNAVGPGFINTPLLEALPKDALAAIAGMHPMNRLGTAEEVAAVVTFLTSPAASFVTGAYYPVDGGYLAR